MKLIDGKYLWPFIIVSILLLSIFTCDGDESQSQSDTPRTSMSDAEAKLVAEMKVKTLLKSPSTAKFSGWGDTNIKSLSNGYKITGFADSQNSFGAIIRTNYSIEIYFDKSSEEFKYRNLKVE